MCVCVCVYLYVSVLMCVVCLSVLVCVSDLNPLLHTEERSSWLGIRFNDVIGWTVGEGEYLCVCVRACVCVSVCVSVC